MTSFRIAIILTRQLPRLLRLHGISASDNQNGYAAQVGPNDFVVVFQCKPTAQPSAKLFAHEAHHITTWLMRSRRITDDEDAAQLAGSVAELLAKQIAKINAFAVDNPCDFASICAVESDYHVSGGNFPAIS